MLLQKFFWLCSGVRLSIIKDLKSVHNIYASLGAFVFFTSAFAFLSASYALSYIIEDQIMLYLISILWALFIFNLDRYMILSLDSIAKRNRLFYSIPRIIIAIFLALLISKPLELKLFEKEIDSELMSSNLEKSKLFRLNALYDSSDVDLIRNAITNKELKVRTGDSLVNYYTTLMLAELDGSGGTKKIGEGPVFKAKKNSLEIYKSKWDLERKVIESDIVMLDKQFEQAQAKAEVKIQGFEDLNSNTIALMERLIALNTIKSKESSIFWAGFLIMMLFIFIESSPVLFKVLSPENIYQIKISNEFEVQKTKENTSSKLESSQFLKQLESSV